MRQDQLEKARAARWRQDGNALVTLDDAERWLAETPLCLYLPRRVHLPVPAPSFVEAVAGAPDATPSPERLAAAAEMLSRLVASGAVVALSLFGAAAGVAGEQPDFLATPEALPFLYALQPERNPKRAPSTTGSGRVSPLAAEVYKTLERDGAQTAIELRERLGREVTEAAVLRALGELWHTMRAVPVPATAGDVTMSSGAHWELLVARHRRELSVGSTQSQTTALAMLASFYLRSAVAATGEEVELFLSPVSSRARIRDVVHGLTATRQLGEFSLGGNAQLYVEGTLPEIAEEEVVIAAEDAGLEENEPSFLEASAQVPAPRASEIRTPRTFQRSGPPRPAKPPFSDRARSGFAARERSGGGDRPARGEGGFRKAAPRGQPGGTEFGRRSEASRGSTRGASERPRTAGPRRDFGGDRPRPSAPRTDRPRAERPPRTNRFTSSGQPRSTGGFRSARPASGGFRRDAGGPAGVPAKGAGSRPPSRSGGSPRPPGDRPFRKQEGAGASERPRSFARPGSARPPSARPGFPRSGGETRPPRREGAPFRKPYAPRGEGAAGDRPFKKPYAPRSERATSDRPFKKPYARGERATGDHPFKKPYAPRGERPAGDRPFKKPYAPRGERPAGDRPFKKPYAPRGERPTGDRPFKKPFAPREGRAAAAGDVAARRSFASRPRSGEAAGSAAPRRAYPPRPPADRPASGAARGKTPAARPSYSKPGFNKPGFSKPGFSKAGAAGKRFGSARPSGPASPRPAGPRAGGPASGKPTRGAGRPGGFSPPRRKPKAPGAGDEG